MTARILGIPARDLVRTFIGCLIVAIILFPLYWMTNVSLQPRAALLASELRFLPIPPLVDNYVRVLGEQAGAIGTSLFIATTTAIVCLLIAAPAAYALVVFRLRWLTLFVLMLLVVQMISPVVLLLPLYVLIQRMGLIDTHAGLVLAYAAIQVPFTAWVLKNFFDAVPPALFEAARLDGA